MAFTCMRIQINNLKAAAPHSWDATYVFWLMLVQQAINNATCKPAIKPQRKLFDLCAQVTI